MALDGLHNENRTLPDAHTSLNRYREIALKGDIKGAFQTIWKILHTPNSPTYNIYEIACFFLGLGAIDEAREMLGLSIVREHDPAADVMLGRILLAQNAEQLGINLILKAARADPETIRSALSELIDDTLQPDEDKILH